jgi:amino acid adenylation domain-containing protein
MIVRGYGKITDDLTLIDYLHWRAINQPDRTAYSFLVDGESEDIHLRYAELDRQARAIAALLQSLCAFKERVLLLYPPGLDYVAAFFGCLYVGAVAVPAYPPRQNRSLIRLQAIIADSEASIVLTTASIMAKLESRIAEAQDLRLLRWVASDSIPSDTADDWRMPSLSRDTLAFLQYTSGSTAAPKGVMVSHGNILHNEEVIKRAFRQTEESVIVGWLPLYHDMGLIGNILQPLYTGSQCILMSPLSFLQRPLRWLKAISHYKATTSGGPNFAYDLCVRKTDAEQRSDLDLSRWAVAFNGAEPVRAETIDSFTATFEPYGFRREAFYPCYGLAEATLLVSGGTKKGSPLIKSFDARSLESNCAIEARSEESSALLVACGEIDEGIKPAIVHPESLTLCRQGEVGEIWVASASVAQGYWNNGEETERTFRARVADTSEGPFLRTGDLGFFNDGELFVTGRLKDLLIIRGFNHYPQDIELTIERCHPSLRTDCGAAFSIDVAGEDRLVVVQEVKRRHPYEVEAVIETIRRAIGEEHEIQPYAVVLIKPGTITKTSSNKIQRHACRARFLAGELDVVSEWRESASFESAAFENDSAAAYSPDSPATHDSIRDMLLSEVSAAIGIPSSKLNVNHGVNSFGLDSLAILDLMHKVESKFEISLPVSAFMDGVSVDQLASLILEHLSTRARSTQTEPPASSAASSSLLSHGQQALWFLHQVTPDSSAYNLSFAARILSGVDIPALQRSLQIVLDRHPSLRATFSTVKGEVVQTIHEQAAVSFEQVDATEASDDWLKDQLAKESSRAFDLQNGPLLRVTLFTRSAQQHILLLSAHHIAADFWSLALLVRELGGIYPALEKGQQPNLAQAPAQYSDYVTREAEMLAGPRGERLWSYWREQLAGDLPVINLQVKQNKANGRGNKSASAFFNLDEELSRGLRSIARDHNATLYTVLLAAFQALLHRHSGQDRILVGSPMAGRNSARWSDTVGYFVNPVVLKADISTGLTFSELLIQTRSTTLAALQNQDYPFPLLIEKLQPSRDQSRSPLFQVMFVFYRAPSGSDSNLARFALGDSGAQVRIGDLVLESIPLDPVAPQFDLTLAMTEGEDGIPATFLYDADLFDAAFIDRLARRFRVLIGNIVMNPDRHIGASSLLTEQERDLLLYEWNHTESTYPPSLCIHDLFERQVEQTPSAIAIAYNAEQLTYDELNRKANQLARHLREMGVGPEDRVGIYLARSIELVIGLIAVLKAGAAYVPMEPDYPEQRIVFMLEDTQMTMLLTESSLRENLQGQSARVVCVDADWPAIARQDEENLTPRAMPDNLAYVIYTSGSTGRPKGVAIEHRSTTAFLHWATDFFGDDLSSGVLASTSVCFDLSVFELFAPLGCGGKIILAENALNLPGGPLRDEIRLINTVPSAVAEMLRSNAVPASVRTINLAGEALQNRLVRQIYQLGTVEKVFNLYGPSEDTTYTTFALAPEAPGDNPPIGRPIANTEVYLLDSYLQPAPAGIADELYIGGMGLARCYLNRPDLTAERFIPDPFGKRPGTRLYKTGDLARHLPDGNLEYLGRIDHQVKIRGFRIELGEIEALLAEHPAIRDVAVVVREDASGDKRLVAHVVAQQPDSFDVSECREYLKSRLPDYMVPNIFIPMQSMPLTANGKTDRAALPLPDQSSYAAEKDYVAPRTVDEEKLVAMWKTVLGYERIGVHDNFFELGGHSILATRLMSDVRDSFSIDIPLRSFLESPTVAGLAEAIEKLKASGGAVPKRAITRASRDAYRVKLSSQGMFSIPEALKGRNDR